MHVFPSGDQGNHIQDRNEQVQSSLRSAFAIVQKKPVSGACTSTETKFHPLLVFLSRRGRHWNMIPRDAKKRKKKKTRTPKHGGHSNFPPKSLGKDELLKANGNKNSRTQPQVTAPDPNLPGAGRWFSHSLWFLFVN